MDTNRSERAAIVSTQLAEHLPYLLRVARSRVRDDPAAEDAVQATVLAALEGADSFSGRSSLRTWLTGILIHKIHDGFRLDAREPAVAYSPEEDGEHCLAVDSRTPEQALQSRQLGEAIGRALKSLPARQAQAFVLTEMSGLDTARLARTLGASNGNVWVLLHRARVGLRAALKREGYSCARPAASFN